MFALEYQHSILSAMSALTFMSFRNANVVRVNLWNCCPSVCTKGKLQKQLNFFLFFESDQIV